VNSTFRVSAALGALFGDGDLVECWAALGALFGDGDLVECSAALDVGREAPAAQPARHRE